jgi:hypothetical protein
MSRKAILTGLTIPALLWTLPAWTAELRVKITDLDGNARRGIPVEVSANQVRRPGGPPVPIAVEIASPNTGSDDEDAGLVTIRLPDTLDAYLPNNREVFVTLLNRDLSQITIPFLLGTPGRYSLSVVMRKGAQFKSGIETAKAYRGRYGTFLLAGPTGTGMFQYLRNGMRKTVITGLRFLKEDDEGRYMYYEEDNGKRIWAFSMNPDRGCCYSVWVRLASRGKWLLYDRESRFTAENQYEVSWEATATN